MAKEKIRILFIGDAVAPSGFARVNHNIIKYLSKRKYDIYHLGINYFGDPHGYDYNIYPASLGGDVWGFGRLIEIVNKIRPHLIFILNDAWVIKDYLKILANNQIKIPVVVYFPVDAEEHDPEWFNLYDRYVVQAVVYTEFAKRVILDTGAVDPSKLSVIPHGVDTEKFYPLTDIKSKDGEVIKNGSRIARETIYPIKEHPEFLNSFIILNANRNQPRKRIDITIRAFAKFVQNKPKNIKLYLHMGMRDMGWDIVRLAERYNFSERLIISSTNPSLQTVPDDRLNLIYNATDVGLNTGMGEGWGLTSWEHGAVKKAQIVPDHSAMTEIWKDIGILVPSTSEYLYEGTMTLAKIPDFQGVVDALEEVYEDWRTGGKKLEKLGNAAYEKIVSPEYSWKNVSKQFEKIFLKTIKEPIEEIKKPNDSSDTMAE